MAGGFSLTQTKVKVEGNNDEIVFTNLVINQKLADVSDFSFTWRQEEGESDLSSQVDFYKKYLAKEVTINVQDNLSFKGIIYGINCTNQTSLGVEYEIKGKGLPVKLNEQIECNSFYKKTIAQIFGSFGASDITLSPTNKAELFYTVQYNQTTFEFFKMMAIRYGEWLYFDGAKLILGAPKGSAVDLKIDEDITSISINAVIKKAALKSTGFDPYKSEALNSSENAASKGSEMMKASAAAGNSVYPDGNSSMHLAHAAKSEMLTDLTKLRAQAAIAGTVQVVAQCNNSKVNLASKIKIKNASGASNGEYIVTEVTHSCLSNDNYENSFIAVPVDVEVPPYTDPSLFPYCQAQPAIVTHNEDSDGLDRIKVHFPWQAEGENTPWISVLAPHAGKDKGFRFLPEVNDEVMMGFVDNNAEKPYVAGAMHTDKNKSGNAHQGNDLKVIGTKTGRRLEIDDKAGKLRLYDNYSTKTPKNAILFSRTDSDTNILIESQKDPDNYSVISMTEGESLNMGVVMGGDLIVEMRMEKDGKKITIHSKGSIDISADSSINLNSGDINIKASGKLNLEGTTEVNIKGTDIKGTADAGLELKGVMAKVEGTATADFKAGAMASISAALVKIN